MRYYVTGANGFIGKHVVKYLQDKGHEVIPVKRHIGVHHLPVDKEFVFIHLGAYGNHYNQTSIDKIVDANIHSIMYVLQFCKHENCRKLYNISTSSIQLPKQTLYSVSKHFGELMVESCNDSRFVNIRPYSVYGPGEANHRFIPTVIRALRTGDAIQLSEGWHDWIYIDDFIEAMFSGHTDIGTGESYNNITVVEMLEEIHGGHLVCFPISKLRSYDTSSWRCEKGVPHRSFKEGLKLTYERTP